MKILIDCYELMKGYGKSIGIYNYTIGLLSELIPIINRENEIIIITNSLNNKDFNYENTKSVCIDKVPYSAKDKVYWELLGVVQFIKKEKADLYYSPRGFLPPIKNCKMITTIHDLIPLYYKENYREKLINLEKMYIINRLKASCKIADKIITISNFSKKQIVEKFNIDQRKISVIYNGIEKRKFNFEESFKDEKFIFALTSELKHKNLHGILKGYESYCEKSTNPLPLKICGIKNKDKYKDIVNDNVWNKIEFLGYLSDRELHWHYKFSSAFLFLSKIEGFGFPPLEALQYTNKVICLKIPVLKEILNESVVYAEDNFDDIGNKILEVISKEDMYYSDIIENFKWSTCASKFAKEILN